MKRSETRGSSAITAAAICILGAAVSIGWPTFSEAVDLNSFDHQGEKLFVAYEVTPDAYMAADSGDRNLEQFYALRQYPGSPPRIPHEVNLSFAGDQTNCLSCHEKGGYSQEFEAFVPVTPHPENTLCYQCHTQVITEETFVGTDWQSIRPPKLGRSFLGSSPPPVPHSLQLRENCISCHTGPGAVVELRVEHSARGNCRQCHVEVVQSTPIKVFARQAK